MKKSSSFLLLLLMLTVFLNVHAQGSWAPLTSGTTNHLLGVSAPSSGLCFVCGASGTIRKSSNAGVTWIPLSSGTTQNLYTITFMDVLTGYCVGDNGTALKTTDAGVTWVPMTVGTAVSLRYVYFIDPSNGFISGAGGLILKTTDGGTTWNTTTTGTTSTINSVFFTSSATGYASGTGGTLLKTNTSGSTWLTLTSGVVTNLNIAYFTSSTSGIVSGDGGVILQTTTSGTSWGTVASGTTDLLFGLEFIDSSNGYMVGGNIALNTGNILQTTDGGTTWTSFLPGSSRLSKIDFVNASLGYAVGLDGTILQYTVPYPPDATFTSSAPGCIGQTTNFYSVMAGIPGVTDSWNFGTSSVPATSTSSNPTGVLYFSFGAKIVTHITTTALGSDTATNIITINPAPSATYTYTPLSCPGTPISFNNFGTTGPGITFSWDFGEGASPLISTAENPSGITYSTGGPKIITFNVTNQYGCTTSETQTISIDSLPVADAGMDSTICFNTSIQLGGSAVSGMTYSWTPSTSLDTSSISNPTASPVASYTQYILTVTNSSTGCASKDTTTITMLPALIANAGNDGEICKNDSVQIGTGLILGQTYSWSPSTGLSDTTTANPMVTPIVNTTYTLTITGNGCGSVTDEVSIVVHDFPIGSAGADDTTIAGTSVQLNATGGILYSWSPASTLDNIGIYNPMASPESTTSYTVIITDLFGCARTDVVKITVIAPSFWVPTAFTPDGNGSSDVFYVRGEGILNFEFSIFNRWGERIFFTRDILTGWDGTRQASGDKMPEGAYVYQVKGTLSDGTIVNSKGMINLIR